MPSTGWLRAIYSTNSVNYNLPGWFITGLGICPMLMVVVILIMLIVVLRILLASFLVIRL